MTQGNSAHEYTLFARIYGIVFLIVGIGGFIPGLAQPHEHPGLIISGPSGMELGLFPVNVLDNAVHILFGVWGLVAASSLAGAVLYAHGVAVIYALLTVLGLIPAANTAFGLVPIYGHDVWLHAVLAVVTAYFGFTRKEGTAAA
jgi:hypothetical protein